MLQMHSSGATSACLIQAASASTVVVAPELVWACLGWFLSHYDLYTIAQPLAGRECVIIALMTASHWQSLAIHCVRARAW